jgi:hypothetical protein
MLQEEMVRVRGMEWGDSKEYRKSETEAKSGRKRTKRYPGPAN